MENNKVNIEVNSGYYTCGQGCCDTNYTNVTINGKELEDHYSEDDTIILAAVLESIGIDYNEICVEDTNNTLKIIFDKMNKEYAYNVTDTTEEDYEQDKIWNDMLNEMLDEREEE